MAKKTMVRIKKGPAVVEAPVSPQVEAVEAPVLPQIGADQAATLVSQAVVKELSDRLKGSSVPSGRYKVHGRILLEVAAVFVQSGPESYTPTISIPLKAVLALLIQRMGFPRDKAMEVLSDCMAQALKAGTEAAPFIQDHITQVEIAMARVEAMANTLPKKTRRGKLTCRHREVVITALSGSVDCDEPEE